MTAFEQYRVYYENGYSTVLSNISCTTELFKSLIKKLWVVGAGENGSPVIGGYPLPGFCNDEMLSSISGEVKTLHIV